MPLSLGFLRPVVVLPAELADRLDDRRLLVQHRRGPLCQPAGNGGAGEHRSRNPLARNDGGPTLIECKTYRYVGHHEGDPGTDYRTREEVQHWKQQDPVKLARKRLLDSGADESKLKAIDQEVEQLIDEAVEFAEKSPEPSADSVNEHVF